MTSSASASSATIELTPEQREALREEARYELARRSFPYMLKNFTYIESDDPQTVGPMKLEPWNFQMERAEAWGRGESEVWLKRRQVGASWLFAAYIHWVAAYHEGWHVGLFSKGEREVEELMRKVRFVADHMPEALFVGHKGLIKMQYGSKSLVHGFPSTESTGISFTFRLVVADEAAFHPYGRQNYAAYRPAIAAGGQYLAGSTADPSLGPSGFFYDLYWDSKRGDTPYKAVFTGRWARPDQGDKWFATEKSAHKGHPEAFDAFYPLEDTDAFVARAGLVYPMFDYQRHVIMEGLQVDGRNSGNPLHWQECIVRFGGTDYGGGDPTAFPIAGVYKDVNGTRKIHVYDCLYKQNGAPTVEELYRFSGPYHARAPFRAIAGDPAPGGEVINASLRSLGLPVTRADNSRYEGLSLVAWFLENNLITFNGLSLEKPLHEFMEYRWLERVDQHSRDRYNTSTPQDHHGDFLDALRYLLMKAYVHEWNRVDKVPMAFSGVKYG